MRQTANTFHILSETIIGKTDTHRGSAEIPSMKIARVNIKRWRKKEVRREGNVQPLPRECQNKRTLPPQGCFQVFKFFDAWRTISDFFFFYGVSLQQVSLLEGKLQGSLMRGSKEKAHRRELAEEAASSTVKIGIHTRKYYPRHHCQGKWIKGRAIILRPSARKVRTK